MKKWLMVVGAIVILGGVAIGSIYILIPAKITISNVVTGKCNISAANRYFSDTSKWGRWWPAGYSHQITGVFYNHVTLNIQKAGDSNISGNMRIAQLNKDSMLIGLDYSFSTSNDPLKKIAAYRQKDEIHKHMNVILNGFKSFVEENKNIYGVDFHRTLSRDSALVTMTRITKGYPTTTYIYQLIDSLAGYISGQGAVAINYPMLNVSRLNENQFKLLVAISVNRSLPGNSRIISKRFVPWKMIEGEVNGGNYSVDKAMENLFKFRDDYHISIMAIPFQSLITDRRKEQDTTKWVTKVCAPIS